MTAPQKSCVDCMTTLQHSDEYLLTRYTGVYRDPTTSQCELCPEGCSYCSSPDLCTGCDTVGYYQQGSVCIKCTDHCRECYYNPPLCEFCHMRYYKSADGTQCLPCAEGCIACSGPTLDQCTACDLDRGYMGVS